jgi:hypothetical protein
LPRNLPRRAPRGALLPLSLRWPRRRPPLCGQSRLPLRFIRSRTALCRRRFRRPAGRLSKDRTPFTYTEFRLSSGHSNSPREKAEFHLYPPPLETPSSVGLALGFTRHEHIQGPATGTSPSSSTSSRFLHAHPPPSRHARLQGGRVEPRHD